MSDDLVVVIDDDVSVRRALGNLLDSVGLTHLACAAPEDLSEADLAGRPACLVLDVRMPGCNGLDFHEAFAARHPEVPVIFITGHGDVPMSVRAMKAGAIEFLTKPFREQDLLDAIYAGLAQSRQRLAREAEHDDLRRRHASLSPRECEVMAMIVDEGLQSKQIAAKLGLSEITVKLCRGSLMKKLGAASPVDLGMMAERLKGPDPIASHPLAN
jgi:FixJ family two-component response regulator